MEWINGLFTTHSALQTMVLLSLIIAAILMTVSLDWKKGSIPIREAMTGSRARGDS